jgi:dihydropyrimidinase
MGVTRFDAETEAQLREIVRDGTASFKIFLSYKNFFGVTDEEMFHTLKLAAELGVITTAHCENAELVSQLQQLLLAEGKTGPEWHEPSRPEAVEAEGTTRFATFVEEDRRDRVCGASLVRACAACRSGSEAAWREAACGISVPHFLLDKSMRSGPAVEGMKHVMSPPLRDKRNQAALWRALEAGLIDTVGTDHCPFDIEQKLLGAKAFTQIPNGIPGLEDRVNLMYTYGVKRGGLSIHRFVDALSTRAAKLFGLYPAQGYGCSRIGCGPGYL